MGDPKKVEIEIDVINSTKKEPKFIDSVESETKVVEKVISGEAKQAKKSVGSLFREVFSPENMRGLGGYIATAVILPSVRSMIYDAGTQGLGRMLWGEDGSPNTPTRGGPIGAVSYSSISTNKARQRSIISSGGPIPKQHHHKKEEVYILDTRGDAEVVIEGLSVLIETYGHATVADYYELIGKTAEYTDNKWGWTSLSGTRAERVHGGGYIVNLPPAQAIQTNS